VDGLTDLVVQNRFASESSSPLAQRALDVCDKRQSLRLRIRRNTRSTDQWYVAGHAPETNRTALAISVIALWLAMCAILHYKIYEVSED
jgi:hypothetical protein